VRESRVLVPRFSIFLFRPRRPNHRYALPCLADRVVFS
jgi:hypothetical protein